MAVNCGTPWPVTIRVVQILPGPTPTLIPSAPAATKSNAPCAVATFPAMIGMENFILIALMASIDIMECP